MPEETPKRDLGDLLPEEAYAVTCVRTIGEPLRAYLANPFVVSCGHVPVCTWDTLFRLLGRGVIKLDEAAQRADRYELDADWR
jgi:hypothetical protein